METKREKLDRRLHELKQARYPYETIWRDTCDQFLPYQARWTPSDFRNPKPRPTEHINNTPLEAQRILAAGLMAGITSPSRIWYHLTTADKQLDDKHRVRRYLNLCEEIQREHLAQGRFYQSLADGVYQHLGVIATGAMFCEARPFGVRFEPMVIGEYFLDVDHENEVDTCFRVRMMTAHQIAGQFGLEGCSDQVKQAISAGRHGQAFQVCHAVYPNNEYLPTRADAFGKRWASDWWEVGNTKGFLRSGGYEEFPVMAPRWNGQSGEAYGNGSPGWIARGDCGGLQHDEDRFARLVDKVADPPMVGVGHVEAPSLLPGSLTLVKEAGDFRPAMQVAPAAMEAIATRIERAEQRVNRAFYVNLWLALLSDQRAQRPTATEVEARRDEVMLQLGPLLENLNNGLLEPAINRSFAILQRQRLLPDPPPELQGTEGAVRVEFISVLHRAQKMTGIVGLREFVALVREIAGSGKPEVVDKVNADALMDELTAILGIKPEIVLSEDQVQTVRHAKAQQQSAAQQGQAMLAATQGARNLAGVDPQKLSELATAVAPAAAAQAGTL